jgi:hypothetical protein
VPVQHPSPMGWPCRGCMPAGPSLQRQSDGGVAASGPLSRIASHGSAILRATQTAGMFLRTLHEDPGWIVLFCARLGVLINLLRTHRRLYPPRCFKLIISLWLCLFLQISLKREDKFYKEHVDHIDLEDDPVFITGHWRSGTIYLHYLMGLDIDNFAYPTSYQCLFPTIFLIINEKLWCIDSSIRSLGPG